MVAHSESHKYCTLPHPHSLPLCLSSSSSISFPIWEFVWFFFAGFNLSLCGWPSFEFAKRFLLSWHVVLSVMFLYTCVKPLFFPHHSLFLVRFTFFFRVRYIFKCKITFIVSTIFPIELWIAIWCLVFSLEFLRFNIMLFSSLVLFCVSLSKLMTFSQQFGGCLWNA